MVGARRGALAAACWLAALVPWPAAAVDAQWSFGAEAGLGYDSNVGNAQWQRDIRDSFFSDLMLSAQRAQPFGASGQWQLRGMISAEESNDFEGLSHRRGALGARIVQRVGEEFFAPTLVAGVTVDYAEFDSELRDSTGVRFAGSLLQQLTTEVSGRVSLNASWRDADSEVFDLGSKSVGGHLDWTATPRLLLSIGYDFHDGRVVSSGTPTLAVVRVAEAIEPDDAFGGRARNQFAYRLHAQTHAATAGMNIALSRRLSFDTRLQYFDVSAEGNNQYTRWVGVGSLLARF